MDLSTSTEFYDRLAPVFDVMTDWPARLAFEAPFWRRLFAENGARSVLDAACGTGGHTLEFARWGLQAAGADISPAMLGAARAKAASEALDVRFVQAAFAELPDHFGPELDVVVCVGNSLPHAVSDAELDAALRGLAAVVRPGGLLAIQNLNYDRRWRLRPRFFALDSGMLAGREVLIWRFADYHDGPPPRIAFHTAVFEKNEAGRWSVQVNSTPQRPLFRDDLLPRLAPAGLAVEATYGGLDGSPFDPASSGDLVVVARRVASGH